MRPPELPPITEPTRGLPPIGDPRTLEPAELFPFRKSLRDWYMRAEGGRCHFPIYDERRGWHECGAKATDVHHIVPEGWLLAHGEDPEQAEGMALCKNHHTNNFGGDIYDERSSMHPDMAQAHRDYHGWKQQQEHLASITGRKSIDYKTSPYAEAAHEHHDLAQRGERYWTGTEATDEYLLEKARERHDAYIRSHPDDPKPIGEPHPRTDHSKRTRWTDNTFDSSTDSNGVTTTTRKPRWFRRG